MTGAPRLFLCHSSADKPFVMWLAKELSRAGIGVWFDEWEIRVGDSIVKKINEGISTSDYLVVVLSKAFVKSPWAQEELSSGILRTIQSQGAFILPLIIEDCEIPPLLAHRRYADFRENRMVGLSELLEATRLPEDRLSTRLQEYVSEFDEVAVEIRDASTMGVAAIPLKLVFVLNLIMEEAVRLRFAHEVDGTLLAKSMRWSNFYDQLEFLKTRGIDLSGVPIWGSLRNIRNYAVHPNGAGWPDDYHKGLEQLVGGLSELREVLVKLMAQSGQQDASTGRPASPAVR
jgi:hypothetical protein